MTKITVTFDDAEWSLVRRKPTPGAFDNLIPRGIRTALRENSQSALADFFARLALASFPSDYQRMIDWADPHPGVRAALNRARRERNKRAKAAADRRKAKEKAAKEAKRAGRSVKAKG